MPYRLGCNLLSFNTSCIFVSEQIEYSQLGYLYTHSGGFREHGALQSQHFKID